MLTFRHLSGSDAKKVVYLLYQPNAGTKIKLCKTINSNGVIFFATRYKNPGPENDIVPDQIGYMKLTCSQSCHWIFLRIQMRKYYSRGPFISVVFLAKRRFRSTLITCTKNGTLFHRKRIFSGRNHKTTLEPPPPSDNAKRRL